MKRIVGKIAYALSDLIKRLTGEITTDKKFFFTVSVLFVFSALSLYMSYQAIYQKGKWDAMQKSMEIRHITVPGFRPDRPTEFIDSEISGLLPDTIDTYLNHSDYEQDKGTKKG